MVVSLPRLGLENGGGGHRSSKNGHGDHHGEYQLLQGGELVSAPSNRIIGYSQVGQPDCQIRMRGHDDWEIPWQPSSFCQTKVGSFEQWRDDPSPEHRMDGWERPFRAVATRLLRSLARVLRRIVPPASARRFAKWYGGPEGLDGRLATVGLRQPAHSHPTIPAPCAIGGARRYIDGDPIVRYDDPPDGSLTVTGRVEARLPNARPDCRHRGGRAG